MPPPFQKHVFVCLHERDKDDEKGDCASKGAEKLLKSLKKELKQRGLAHDIRANKSGCLDNCSRGCSLVVYPEGVWYGGVTEDDVPDLVDHLAGGAPVERLRLFADGKKAEKA